MGKWLVRVSQGCVVLFVLLGALSITEGLLDWSPSIRGQLASGPAVVFFGALYLLVAAGFAGVLWMVRRGIDKQSTPE